MNDHTQTRDLRLLIDHLAVMDGRAEDEWRGWRVTRVGGGANNLLYRATGGERDLAVKFAIRDDRDRAGREFAALLALRRAGLDLAPAPLLIDRRHYPQPVVVQTWLAGEVCAGPPADDAEWRRLIEHYAAIHSLTPHSTPLRLRPAVLNMRSVEDGFQRIRQQIEVIPEGERTAELRELVARAEQRRWPYWTPAPLALCHDDANARNVVRRSGPWASVDWENSGWGDPAFEIADLITHPTYLGVPAARWDWATALYCELCGDQGAAERIEVYRALMLVWWVARLGRALHQVPRGGDQRLAQWPAGWHEEMQANYARYLAMAHT